MSIFKISLKYIIIYTLVAFICALPITLIVYTLTENVQFLEEYKHWTAISLLVILFEENIRYHIKDKSKDDA